MDNHNDWKCPKCGSCLRNVGVRIVHRNVDCWEEWLGSGNSTWYIDSKDHGDAESFEIWCLECDNELPSELAKQVHQDMEENWE